MVFRITLDSGNCQPTLLSINVGLPLDIALMIKLLVLFEIALKNTSLFFNSLKLFLISLIFLLHYRPYSPPKESSFDSLFCVALIVLCLLWLSYQNQTCFSTWILLQNNQRIRSLTFKDPSKFSIPKNSSWKYPLPRRPILIPTSGISTTSCSNIEKFQGGSIEFTINMVKHIFPKSWSLLLLL